MATNTGIAPDWLSKATAKVAGTVQGVVDQFQRNATTAQEAASNASNVPSTAPAYDPNIDYSDSIAKKVAAGDFAGAALDEQSRNKKIDDLGLPYDKTYQFRAYIDNQESKEKAFGVLDQIQNNINEQASKEAEFANKQIDYATEQGIKEAERAEEDAQPMFQNQRNQIAIDERVGQDNAALYAEARGDRGGIGQAQYNAIAINAAKSRLAVQQAQTKLATDTQRLIVDLRSKGEYEKAEAALKISQEYFSQIHDLLMYGIELGLKFDDIKRSLDEMFYNRQMDMISLTGRMPDGSLTYQAEKDVMGSAQDLYAVLAEAGVPLTAEQMKVAFPGMTSSQLSNLNASNAAKAAASGYGSSSGGGGGSGGSGSGSGSSSAAKSSSSSGSKISQMWLDAVSGWVPISGQYGG